MNKIFKNLSLILITLVIAGCDNHLYTQFFKNPHIVDIGKIEHMQANKWYEFDTEVSALNRTQNVIIRFNGSEPSNLSRESIGDFNNTKSIFRSTKYPGKIIEFKVIATDNNSTEYDFEAVGRSNGIVFSDRENNKLMGKTFSSFKIQSNLSLKNVVVYWNSYTGK